MEIIFIAYTVIINILSTITLIFVLRVGFKNITRLKKNLLYLDIVLHGLIEYALTSKDRLSVDRNIESTINRKYSNKNPWVERTMRLDDDKDNT